MACNGPWKVLLSWYERSIAKFGRTWFIFHRICLLKGRTVSNSSVFSFLFNLGTNVSVLERRDKKRKTVWNLVGWPDQDVRGTLCLVDTISKLTLEQTVLKMVDLLKNKSYIQKTGLAGRKNPQKIQIFRGKSVSERENYEFCNVLEKNAFS